MLNILSLFANFQPAQITSKRLRIWQLNKHHHHLQRCSGRQNAEAAKIASLSDALETHFLHIRTFQTSSSTMMHRRFIVFGGHTPTQEPKGGNKKSISMC